VYYFHCIDLARERQQALLDEAAHDQLVQQVLRNGHSATPVANTWSFRTVLHRASHALGFAPLTRNRVG